MKNKLGSYINNLMETIRNTEEKSYLRELALEELKKLSQDVSGFIFKHIDDIECLPDFEEDGEKAKKLYLEHWTCSICGDYTDGVEYDYLSGTDHLSCVLKEDTTQTNQLQINFGEEE